MQQSEQWRWGDQYSLHQFRGVEAQRAALSLRQESLKNELLRMRHQQLIEVRREHREELRAHVQRLEQQVRHYEHSTSSPTSVSSGHDNKSWTCSGDMDRLLPFAQVDQRLPGTNESFIEKLVQQNEQIMALLLPQRHDANSVDKSKPTSMEVAGRTPSASSGLSDAKTGTQNTADGKSNTSAREMPIKKPVPMFQTPATLSWLPEFEWTEEDELALDKLEKDADALPDIPVVDANAQETKDPANITTAAAIASKDQKTRDRLESRKKLEALLSASLKNAGGGALRKPRWRLEAEAEGDDVSLFDPEDAEAMDPLQIFRSAVLAVLCAVHLKKLLMAKKLAEKESAMRHFEAMLLVYFDATRMWLGKVVKTPLLSLLQDSSLDVDISTRSDLVGSSLRGFAKKFGGILSRRTAPPPLPDSDPLSNSTVDLAKLLKLKVRMRGILQALSKAIDKKEVPSGILDFLKRISTDGVYFPSSYQLFDEERRSLEFDDLGATRRMDFDGTNLTDYEHGRNEGMASACRACDGFSRFNMAVINFLLIRILIPHVILQPWNVGIGSKNIGKQASANLTSVATLLYCICRQLSPLPRLVESPSLFLGRRRSKMVAISQPTTNDESPASIDEIDPALTPAEPKEEEHSTDASSFLSIDEIGRSLISDKSFPNKDPHVVHVIQEHQAMLQETLTHLRSQLYGSQ